MKTQAAEPALEREGMRDNGKKMSLQPLIDELQKPIYAAMSDAEAADAINAKKIQTRRPVSTADLKRHLIESGLWSRISFAIQSTQQSDAVRSACLSIKDWIDDPCGKVSEVDLDRPSVGQLVAVLVAAGIAMQSEASAFIALGSVSVPWTSVNGLPEVGIGLIINARKEMVK